MKNITVFIDFEEKADELINYAANFAEHFGAKVWIIHVAAPDPDFVGFEAGPISVRDIRAEELRMEHQIIQDWTHNLRNRGLDAEGLLIQGPTVETILDEIDKLDADLAMIGHHDHGFLYKAFFGDTAAKVVRKSKKPVLVIPI